eukprot:8987268-Alexandrium_andersonii.AAC.1
MTSSANASGKSLRTCFTAAASTTSLTASAGVCSEAQSRRQTQLTTPTCTTACLPASEPSSERRGLASGSRTCTPRSKASACLATAEDAAAFGSSTLAPERSNRSLAGATNFAGDTSPAPGSTSSRAFQTRARC